MNKDCIKNMYPSTMIKEYIDTDLAYAERKQKISSLCSMMCSRAQAAKHTREELKMNINEIIRDFISTGRAIYKTVLKNEESEGNDIPDSITLSAEMSGGEIVEITIAVKDNDVLESAGGKAYARGVKNELL